MMYTRKIIEVMKVAQLKSVCSEYELKISGNKQELIDRIISHQEKITQKQVAYEKLMKHGAEERRHRARTAGPRAMLMSSSASCTLARASGASTASWRTSGAYRGSSRSYWPTSMKAA